MRTAGARLAAPLTLVALSLSGPLPAAPAPTQTAWYRISLQGHPTGYMSSTMRRSEEADGRSVLEVIERQVLVVALGGQTLQITSDAITHYRENLLPFRWRLHMDKLGVPVEITAERVGDQLRVVSTEGAQTQELTLDLPEDFGSDLQVFAAVARGELPPGEARTVTLFQPAVSALDQQTFTVGTAEPVPVEGAERLCFPVSMRGKLIPADTRAWIDEQGEPVRLVLPTLLGAVVEKVSEAQALELISPLVLHNSIPLNRNLPPPPVLKELTLRATMIGQDPAEVIPTTPRQQVTAGEPGQARVVVRAQAPPPQPVQRPVSGEEWTPYLQATQLAPLEDPRLAGLAQEIVGAETDAWRAAQAICHWVYQHLEKVESEPRPLSALEILEEKQGDCSEHAILAAALARAAGIPAKMISGLAAKGDACYYHAWIAVWVGEWVEMDPSWGQILVDAGHLRLSQSALDPVSFARMNLETGRSIGTLSLQVLDLATP